MRRDVLLRPRNAILLLVAAAVVWLLVLLIGWLIPDAGEYDATVPTDVGALPPVPQLETHRGTEPFRVTIRDTRMVTHVLTEIDIPLITIEAELGGPGEPFIRVRDAVVDRMLVKAPIDTIDSPLDLFADLDFPRIVVDRLAFRDARMGELAAPSEGVGEWLYLFRDVDLVLRDVALGGGAPARLGLELSLDGHIRARPLTIERVRVALERTPTRLDFVADADLGVSAAAASGYLTADERRVIDLSADTIVFSELRAIFPDLPEQGGGMLRARLADGPGRTEVLLRTARAASGESTLAGHGRLIFGDVFAADDFTLSSTGIHAADLRALGLDVPLPGVYSGQVTASGSPAGGVRLDGAVRRLSDGRVSLLGVSGVVVTEPSTHLDLRLAGGPVAVGDSTFEAVLEVEGPIDALRVNGLVALLSSDPDQLAAATDLRSVTHGALPAPPTPDRLADWPAERPSARRPVLAGLDGTLTGLGGEGTRVFEGSIQLAADPAALGLRPGPAVTGRASGRVAVGAGGTLDAALRVDSLPLALIPTPSTLTVREGFATGRLQLAGMLDNPVVGGSIRVAGGAGRAGPAGQAVPGEAVPGERVPGERAAEYGVELSDVEGDILLEEGALVVPGITARLGDGRLRLSGRVVAEEIAGMRVTGARPGDVPGELTGELELDAVPLAAIPTGGAVEEVEGHATGTLQLGGTASEPVVSGSVRLAGGGGMIRMGEDRVEVRRLEGEILLTDGAVVIPGLAAEIGEGRVRLSGRGVPGEVAGVRIAGGLEAGAGALDFRLEADSMPLLDDDLAKLRGSADLTLSGTVEAPVVGGTVTPVGWVAEDYFAPDPGIDTQDPPFADLAARAPWPERSRLRAAAAAPAAETETGGALSSALAAARGRLVVNVTHGFRIIDEDSEIRGSGQVVVGIEEGDITTDGRVSIDRGFYAQFGERFEVIGGVFVFDGNETMPRVALRARYLDDAPLMGGDEAEPITGRFPPVEFFGYGQVGEPPLEKITQYSLLPRGQMELAELLLMDAEPQPVTGWRHPVLWRTNAGAELFGERAESQALPLLWSYTADESYDYIPLEVGYLRAGIITVGSPYPSRLVVGPVLKATGVLNNRMELRVSQPLDGGAIPGVTGLYRIGDLRLEAFSGPRFYAATSLGLESPGFISRRRTGIGLRWGSEY